LLFNVSRGVSHNLRSQFAQQDMNAKNRRFALFGKLDSTVCPSSEFLGQFSA
jgi:hypothetical protein